MQKRNNILYISFILVTLTMLTAFVVSELPRSEYDVFVGKVTRNLRKCMGAREASVDEYERLKERSAFWYVSFFSECRNNDLYVDVREEDLRFAEYSLNSIVDSAVTPEMNYKGDWKEKILNSPIELENMFLHYNDLCYDACEKCYNHLQIYRFKEESKAKDYFDYLQEDYERLYKDNRWQIRKGVFVMDVSDYRIGINSGEKYLYYVYDTGEVNDYISEIYCYLYQDMVVTIYFGGSKNDKLYHQYEKFMKQMQFEGIDDIVLEPVEIVD